MFVKASTALLILPGVFGVLVPALLIINDPWKIDGYIWGSLISITGLVMLSKCVCDFYVSGKGTLAPWAPPKNLVVTGLYKYTRNPMYVGVLLMVAGAAFYFGSPYVAVYSVILAIGFHLRVIKQEEPWLKEQFGEEWINYSSTVSRWLPQNTKRKN